MCVNEYVVYETEDGNRNIEDDVGEENISDGDRECSCKSGGNETYSCMY